MTSFYTNEELKLLGFKKVGENVCISRKASFYSIENISLGNNVRIDDFCILSGKIELENYIHIASYSCLYGGEEGIQIGDFANISSRVAIYAINDDYHGFGMTNPMIPEKYRNVTHKKVVIDKHVIIGTSSTVLPGVTLEIGSAIGAMSLVNKDCEEFTIYAGIPIKKIKERKRDILDVELNFRNEELTLNSNYKE